LINLPLWSTLVLEIDASRRLDGLAVEAVTQDALNLNEDE